MIKNSFKRIWRHIVGLNVMFYLPIRLILLLYFSTGTLRVVVAAAAAAASSIMRKNNNILNFKFLCYEP